MEYVILWAATILCFGSMFIWMLRKPIKDWLIIFLLKSVVTAITDCFIIAADLLDYPIRFFPKVFDTNIVFDFLVFPTLCVFYNITTQHSKLKSIFVQALLYSIPVTLLEFWAEKNTELITYKHWNAFVSLITLMATFLIVRGAIAIVRKVDSYV
ncbi:MULTISPECIES: CBO0543 family protein [Paenibacillus]|uniref:CBO0543 family protein n=1 Tax=Paenibacillus violae TaxID=3077234 RepID=A0ABU3R7Q2_9BACL|nr:MULTISPECIES: CBO0543 family protein [Paenibacillus]MDU0200086.1 CBO0543 family protein [Paenibacillus sp. PFR10]MEC0270888.1 hypothetical protein [Paenibacillus anseongense]